MASFVFIEDSEWFSAKYVSWKAIEVEIDMSIYAMRASLSQFQKELNMIMIEEFFPTFNIFVVEKSLSPKYALVTSDSFDSTNPNKGCRKDKFTGKI